TQDSALLQAPESTPLDGSNSLKVFIKTYGCQMNVYDSMRMSDALARDGYEPTEDMEEADGKDDDRSEGDAQPGDQMLV
ncbi:hypothetical protein ACC739_38040, partial [Rhizobium ruizarguesonis]